MKFERTQRGNPHQLTILQHCFPRRSIERFISIDDRVDLRLINQAKTIRVKSDEQVFCARRAWDQRAESSFMQEIEGAYQNLANQIANGDVVRRFSRQEEQIITDMYALWNIRWHWKNQPVEDQRIEGAIGVTHQFSPDEQEMLEKNHITVIRPDLTIPGRNLTGMQIQKNLFQVRKDMDYVRWGILKSRCGEFIVPDNSSRRLMLPVTPQICLTNIEGYRIATKFQLSEINAQAIQESKEYYFARLFSECPVIKSHSERGS